MASTMRQIQSWYRSDLTTAGVPMSVVYSVSAEPVKVTIRPGNYVDVCLYTSPPLRRSYARRSAPSLPPGFLGLALVPLPAGPSSLQTC